MENEALRAKIKEMESDMKAHSTQEFIKLIDRLKDDNV